MSGKDGGPAFPHEPFHNPAYPRHDDVRGTRGMSLRDYFAGKALQGFCANTAAFASNPMSGWGLVNATPAQLADYTYEIADAMLKAREQ